jgi:hypothetical protein
VRDMHVGLPDRPGEVERSEGAARRGGAGTSGSSTRSSTHVAGQSLGGGGARVDVTRGLVGCWDVTTLPWSKELTVDEWASGGEE